MAQQQQQQQQLGLKEYYGPFINNEFLPAQGQSFPAVNAGTGAQLSQLARAGKDEIDLAVQAAQKAFPVSAILYLFAALLFPVAFSPLPRPSCIQCTNDRI